MTSPRVLLSGWNIHAKKQLGQNFLSDPSMATMIVERAGIRSHDVVVEIGSGLGALTIPAATAAKKIYAVETDRRITRLLKTELTINGVTNADVFEENILTVDLKQLFEREGRRLFILGNLPYNISSQILVWMTESRQAVDRAVLMFQKELAERLKAEPGNKSYGRISVLAQYCADIKKIAEVGASCFYPRPKIDSTVLEFRFHHPPRYPAESEQVFTRLVKAGFSKRRKTLKNALSTSELNIEPARAAEVLEASHIDPGRRAETLTIEEFVRLSNVFTCSPPSKPSDPLKR